MFEQNGRKSGGQEIPASMIEQGNKRKHNKSASLNKMAFTSGFFFILAHRRPLSIPNGSSASAAGPQPPMRVRQSGSLPHICRNVSAARKSKIWSWILQRTPMNM